jgi:hypothetical protein
MNLSTYTILITYFIASLGYTALFMVRGVGAPFVLTAAGSAALSLLFNLRGMKAFRDALWNFFAVFALLFFVADFVALSGSLIISAARFITLLLTLKLFGLKKNSDYLVVFGLVFFQLVAAATSTVSPFFFLLLALFVLSGIWAMIMFTVKKDWQDTSHKELPSIEFGWPFFISVICISFASIVVTLILFFVIPRMGLGSMDQKAEKTHKVTGFSDQMSLGDVAPFKTDSTVIMRVTPEGAPVRLFYLRGSTFDHFDGMTWSKPVKSEVLLKRAPDGRFYFRKRPEKRTALVLNIVLEPVDSEYIFSSSGAFAVSGHFRHLWLESSGGALHLPSPPFSAVEYWVHTDRSPLKEAPVDGRYMDLSYLEGSANGERIRELAKSIVAGEKDDNKKARKILIYLQKNFRYNLNPPASGPDPLADFLFRTKEGYCQHYATAMAVLLRAAGVPSRVINGYQQGEWNDLGNYFIVRQSDAHSWVEANIDGSWLTFDPTPSGLAAAKKPSRLFLYLDYWRMRWNRHIINFSLDDQRDIAGSIEGRASRLLSVLKDPMTLAGSSSGRAFLAVLFISAAVFAFKAVRKAAGNKSGRTPAFYIEMTRILKKKGIRRRPDETPLEFASRLNNPRIDLITTAYHEERYGGGVATKEALAEVKKAVQGLKNSRL